jgi:hypothetical protein
MFIPGFIINWLTFPGVILHEIAHKVACDFAKLKVMEVKLLDKGGGGHVVHEKPDVFWKYLLVVFMPLFFNSLFTAVFTLVAVLTNAIPFVPWIFLWLALSAGMHSIPSTGDAKSLWQGSMELIELKKYWAVLGLPLVGLIYLAAVLRFFWFDAIYAVFLIALTSTALGVSIF